MKKSLNKLLLGLSLLLAFGYNTSFGQVTTVYKVRASEISGFFVYTPGDYASALTLTFSQPVLTAVASIPEVASITILGNTIDINFVPGLYFYYMVGSGVYSPYFNLTITTTSPVTYNLGSGVVNIPPPLFTLFGPGTSPELDSDVILISSPGPSTPTLSQWGLILLSLLLLSFGMVFVHIKQSAMVLAGVMAEEKTATFNRGLYFKSLGGVLLVAIAGLVSAYRYFGTLSITDTLGTLASACVVAYMVQLSLLRRE